MNKISKFAALSIFTASAIHAAPMDPADRPAPGSFSPAVLSNFILMADSTDPKLVYYVPIAGAIAVDEPGSADPIPRFSAMDYIPSFGFWQGETLTRLGGSFDTTKISSLTTLNNEAARQGLKIIPAPVTSASVQFALGTTIPEGNRLNVNCTKETGTYTTSDGQTKTINTPKCFIANTEGEYKLDTNIMQSFTATNLPANSVVTARVPFQAVTLPGQSGIIHNLLATGSQWDGVLDATVDWTVKTNTTTRQARAVINWKSTFEQASAFAAIHNNACVDIELQGLWRKLSTCDDADKCGVKLEYLTPSGQWTNVAPSDPEFINQVTAFGANVEKELFNQVNAYTTSQLGEVSKEKTAFFTLRANYEKLMLSRNETRYFTWTPGNKALNARTDLKISCLVGGFEMSRVKWNMEDAGCRSLIGQQ